jgi:hypothetical protein
VEERRGMAPASTVTYQGYGTTPEEAFRDVNDAVRHAKASAVVKPKIRKEE